MIEDILELASKQYNVTIDMTHCPEDSFFEVRELIRKALDPSATHNRSALLRPDYDNNTGEYGIHFNDYCSKRRKSELTGEYSTIYKWSYRDRGALFHDGSTEKTHYTWEDILNGHYTSEVEL